MSNGILFWKHLGAKGSWYLGDFINQSKVGSLQSVLSALGPLHAQIPIWVMEGNGTGPLTPT